MFSRIQCVVNDAKIQNAPGGSYSERSNLESLAQGASTDVATSLPVTAPSGQNVIPVQTTNVFAPGSQGLPLSHGAKGGPGADDSIQQTPVDAVNQDALLVRALAQANPQSRQLFMMVEAFNEMES